MHAIGFGSTEDIGGENKKLFMATEDVVILGVIIR